jgi:hypothetical protein
MGKLASRYTYEQMRNIRASRVDYYTQHNVEKWHDHLGSLGLGGELCVYLNAAGAAGPVKGREDAMRDVNYIAPIAAAEACMK